MADTISRRGFLQVVAAGGVGGVAGCASTGFDSPPLPARPAVDARQFQYDAQNRSVTGTSPPTDGTLRWRVRRDELGSNERPIDGIVALDGHLLVATRAAIHSLDPGDGTERWRTDPGYDGATPAAVPALSADTAYVAWQQGGEGGLSAIALSDGTERWRSDRVVKVTSNPTLLEETLYVSVIEGPTHGGAILAVDTADGSVRWRFPTAQMPPAPAVADGTVFVAGGNEATVYALDAATGEKHWEVSTADRMRVSPAVADGTVYAPSSFARRMYAFDAADGTKRWRVDADPALPVATTAGSVYLPTRDGVTVLDTDGTERTTPTLGGTRPTTAPVVAGESLLVAGERAVCLDLTDGTERWEQAVEEGVLGHEKVRAVSSEPVVTDDGVFLGTAAGDVYAVGE